MDNKLVSRLTSALETGDFEAHEALLPEYRNSVTAAVTQANTQSFKMELLAAAMRQTGDWLQLAQALRSHIHQELITVSGESHYYTDRDDRHVIYALG